MALLWLPSQHCIVAAKQGEWRPTLGLSEGGQAAAAAKGLSEGLPQHRPQTRAMPRARRARVASPQPCRWLSDALASGLALRKLVYPSSSTESRVLWAPPPRPPQVSGPQPPRRGLHDKQSPLFSTTPPLALRPSSPPAAVTVPACKLLAGNKRLRSGRTRGASPPLSRRAARSPVAGWNCSGGGRLSSPFQRRHCRRPALPGQPPWKPGSARRGQLGRRKGAGPTGSPAGRGGGGGQDWRLRRRGRGVPRLGRGTPEHPAPPPRQLTPSTLAGVAESPPARVSGEEQSWSRRANPLTKESPAFPALARPLRPPPPPPRFFPTRGIRAQPKGEPRRGAPASPTASRLWLGPLGAPSASRDARAGVGGLHYPRLQLCRQRLSLYFSNVTSGADQRTVKS